KRITELENYRKESAEGGLEKYTKKERLMMSKKMERLAKYYSGLIGLKKAPDALFIVDPRAEHIAATEAYKSSIPLVTLANSDSDIKKLDYPIIGNDASIPSISLFTKAVVNAYKAGSSSLTKKEL
ncbi:30S ribosomal protein S2, partial [Candidatus Nomurabacteria bacterium]|nr:30S ribosomal protein S2 [Candidatus Nomurabacteria bacterium]